MHFIAFSPETNRPQIVTVRAATALMHVKADIGDRRDKGPVQRRYVIPSAIVVGVIVGTLALLYMAFYGTHP